MDLKIRKNSLGFLENELSQLKGIFKVPTQTQTLKKRVGVFSELACM